MPWFWQDGTKSPGSVANNSTENPAAISPPQPPQTTNNNNHIQNHTPTNPTTPSITQTLLNPTTLLATAALTTLLLSLRRVYTTRLRRIPNTTFLPANYLLSTPSRSVFGYVTSVGDGDNFRVYHTPGGLLLGWHWLRGVPTARKELSGQTLHVRIAGIDAPEMAHFGRPAQKYGPPALEWLRKTLEGERVRVYTLRRDQYERVVGTAFVRRRLWSMTTKILSQALPGLRDRTEGPILRRDIGLEMIRAGWATVYEASFGAVFGDQGMEAVYKEAEKKAKAEGKGMWAGQGGIGILQPSGTVRALWLKFFGSGKAAAKTNASALESPRQYKTRMAKLDAEAEAKAKAATKR